MTRMKPIKKMISSAIVILLLCHILLGCLAVGRDETLYNGNYPEGYTIAVNNILGENGGPDTEIGIMEADTYGRIMFYYVAESFETKHKWSVLVCQKAENGYVYYYPNVNYCIINKTFESHLYDNNLKEQTYQAISEDELNKLKEENNWGKELDESKMIKTKIIWRKLDIKNAPVNDSILRQAYAEICPNNKYIRYKCSYLTSDEYDRHIYFLRGVDSDGENLNGYYVVLFNSDGTYDKEKGVMEITDLNDYKEELKEFKLRNNWNKP